MKKRVSILLMLLIVVSVFMFTVPKGVSAAEPKLNTKTKTLFVNGSSVRPEYKGTYTLKLKNKPKSYSVKWTSSDISIVDVEWMKSGKAKLTAVGVGEATVTALLHDNKADKDYTLSTKVTVKKNCSDVIITPEVVDLVKVGVPVKLEGKMIDEEGNAAETDVDVTDVLKWVSDDPNVAVVDDFGNVIGVSKGKTTIYLYAVQAKTGAYSKFKKAVAVKSIDVTVVRNVLEEVKQTSLNKFVLRFSDPIIDEVKSEDFTLTVDGEALEIEKIEISQDKTSLRITSKNALSEDVKYQIEWFEFIGDFTASKGNPVKIELYSSAKDNNVVAGDSAEIKVKFYNINGVDITPLNEKSADYGYLMNKVSFHVKGIDGNTDTGAWITDNKVMFLEPGKQAVVVAEYVDIKSVDGQVVENKCSAVITMSSISEASTITLDDIMITNSELTGSKLDWSSYNHNIVAIGDNGYRLVARLKNADGKYLYSDELKGKVTFKTNGDASVLGVFDNGTVFPVLSGSEVIVVEYDKTAVGAKEVAVVPRREATRVVFEEDDSYISSKRVSSNFGVSKFEINVKVLDQYGSVIPVNTFADNNRAELMLTIDNNAGPAPVCAISKDGSGYAVIDTFGYGSAEGASYVYKAQYNGLYGKANGEFVLIAQIPNDNISSTYEVSVSGKTDVTLSSKTTEFPSVKINLCEYKGGLANAMIESIFPSKDNSLAVNDLFYYRVYDANGAWVKDGLENGYFSLVYAEGSLLKKYPAGEYTIKIYKGKNGGYEYITGTTVNVTDSKAGVKIEQIEEKTEQIIYKDMTEDEIATVFSKLFNVTMNGETLPMSNIIIVDPVVGDKQLIIRNVKVRDYVTVKDTAYYFEYEIAVNKQITN